MQNEEMNLEMTTMNQKERESHIEFFSNRNWKCVEMAWQDALTISEMPSWMKGSPPYGMTNMDALFNCGFSEFNELKNPKYKRKTFSIQLGYLGTQYHGFQYQKQEIPVLTVEEDISKALGRTVVSAGRTDKVIFILNTILVLCNFLIGC